MSDIRVVRGAPAIRAKLLERSGELAEVSEAALDRAAHVFGERLSPAAFAARAVAEVAADGDAAVRRISTALGDVTRRDFELAAGELEAARDRAPKSLDADFRLVADRIERFHRRQLPRDFTDDEEGVGLRWRPVDRAGVHVPAAAAPLASSLLMTVIPARVAGVSELVVCTPPGPEGLDPAIALAAHVAGVDRVFAIGGAPAIAAMALGTETVPRCDVVAGPGNAWTTSAKREIFGLAGVDLLPGPTETLIIADARADPEDLAADLIAQAEHGGPAAPVLLTDSDDIAERTARAIQAQLDGLPLREVAADSFARRGGIGVVESLEQAVELSNGFAPEHLCVVVDDPDRLLPLVRHAGGVFVGAGSPEVLGDYVAGPSHVMPTGGTARFESPCGVWAFLKAVSEVRLPADRSAALAPVAARMARAEGLEGHARAAERRQASPPGD